MSLYHSLVAFREVFPLTQCCRLLSLIAHPRHGGLLSCFILVLWSMQAASLTSRRILVPALLLLVALNDELEGLVGARVLLRLSDYLQLVFADQVFALRPDFNTVLGDS